MEVNFILFLKLYQEKEKKYDVKDIAGGSMSGRKFVQIKHV